MREETGERKEKGGERRYERSEMGRRENMKGTKSGEGERERRMKREEQNYALL